MSESCEIYVKPHVAFNLIDVALEGHSGYAARGRPMPASGPEHIYSRPESRLRERPRHHSRPPTHRNRGGSRHVYFESNSPTTPPRSGMVNDRGNPTNWPRGPTTGLASASYTT